MVMRTQCVGAASAAAGNIFKGSASHHLSRHGASMVLAQYFFPFLALPH